MKFYLLSLPLLALLSVAPAIAQTEPTIAPLDAININDTPRFTIEENGLVGVSEAGFSHSPWENTRRNQTDNAIAALPHSISSQSLRDVTITLLGLAGQSPAPSNAGWLLQRISTLNHIGAYDKANALLNSVKREHTSEYSALALNAMFLRETPKRACEMRGSNNPLSALAQSEAQRFLNVYCTLTLHDEDKARLQLELLEEENHAAEWMRLWLERATQGATIPMPVLSDNADDLQTTLYLRLPYAAWPKNWRTLGGLAKLSPQHHLRIVTDSDAPLTLTIPLAEQLVAGHILPVQSLIALYNAAKPSERLMNAPLGSTTAFRSVMGRSALFQRFIKSVQGTDEQAKKTYVTRLIDTYDKAGLASTAHAVLIASDNTVSALLHSREVLDFARVFTTALMNGGAPTFTSPFTENTASLSQRVAVRAEMLSEIFTLPDADANPDAAEPQSQTTASHATLLRITPSSNSANSHIIHALRIALHNDRRGEAVLHMARLTEASGGLAAMDEDILRYIVLGLQHMGYDIWARKLAVESLEALYVGVAP